MNSPTSHTQDAAATSWWPWRGSVLSWPAWLRLLAVLPALMLLWLAVAWALADIV